MHHLAPEQIEARRRGFERRWAEHAKIEAGLPDSLTDVEDRVRADRDGLGYKNQHCNSAWEGYLLAPQGDERIAIPAYLNSLSRTQLEYCIRNAQERLESLNNAAKVTLWLVSVDDTLRYVTREPNNAISWMQRFTTKFLAEPNADLLTGSRSPITFKSMSVFEDEVADWLKGNDEPENFKHW